MYNFLYHGLPRVAAVFLGLYLWLHFLKLPFIHAIGKKWRLLPWFLAVLLVEFCVLAGTDIWDIKAVCVLFLCFSFLVADGVNWTLKKLQQMEWKQGTHFLKWQRQERVPEGTRKGVIFSKVYHVWRKIYFDGVLALLATVAIMGYGYFNMRHVRYTDYHLATEKQGMETGLFFMAISDVHIGTTMTVEEFGGYLEEVAAQEPDFLVVAGDLVDENTPKGAMETACRMLGGMELRYGVYFIYGNHDMGTHGGNPYFDKKDIRREMLENGVQLLYDEVVLVDHRFYIAGRKDAGTVKKRNRKTEEELLAGVDRDKFLLMLDHQPYRLEEEAEAGVDLQISGHTHGGQVWPVGLLTSLFHLNEMNYGYRRLGGYQILVSSGMGGFAYPVRIGSKSEIVRIWINR